MKRAYINPRFFENYCILSLRNNTVSELNTEVLSHLRSNKHQMLSVDHVEKESGNILSSEYLRTLKTELLPPSSLNLKLETPIILLQNLNLKQELCNGTRLRLTHIS